APYVAAGVRLAASGGSAGREGRGAVVADLLARDPVAGAARAAAPAPAKRCRLLDEPCRLRGGGGRSLPGRAAAAATFRSRAVGGPRSRQIAPTVRTSRFAQRVGSRILDSASASSGAPNASTAGTVK